MGVESSTEVPDCYADVQKWTRHRLTNVIKKWVDSEEDFSLDEADIMNLIGCRESFAFQIMDHLTLNKSGTRVNAVTLLITLIALISDEFVNKTDYVSEIFDLFDLAGNERITREVLNVMIMSIGAAFASLLGRTDTPSRECVDALSNQIFDTTGKKYPGSKISKAEVIQWADVNFFCKDIRSINNVLQTIECTHWLQ